MKELEFKKNKKEDMFIYLHVDNISYESLAAIEKKPISNPNKIAINSIIYKDIFYKYLALIDFCTSKLQRYCIIRSSPDNKESILIDEISSSYWNYKLLSDDYFGLGIDIGFVQKHEERKNLTKDEFCLYALENFLYLSRLPEDVFGEVVYQCSLFGLKDSRSPELRSFLQSSNEPDLNNFLQTGEIFAHIVVAKEVGYYNSILIKSKSDIERDIEGFNNIHDPGN